MPPRTTVEIRGRQFVLNGRPVYEGRVHRGRPIEGLLLNARLVQGIFDDRNPATRALWDYPDGPWDADRNTSEFLAAMPAWHRAGLCAFTINLQGGSPQGYSREQPWHNSAFEPDGSLRSDYLDRLSLILDRADALGMAVILGLFYFGQDERLVDEAAVIRGTEQAVKWVCDKGFANVMVEIGNEVDNHDRWQHDIIRPDRCIELIDRVREQSSGRVRSPHGRLLVSTSLCGGRIPADDLIHACDFILLHGNGVASPDGIRRMVTAVRGAAAYRDQPIVFNEDDHFDFDAEDNNMLAAIDSYAGWGYFDYRMPGEGFDEGFQSVPVNWAISSARKRGFFKLLHEVTGGLHVSGVR